MHSYKYSKVLVAGKSQTPPHDKVYVISVPVLEGTKLHSALQFVKLPILIAISTTKSEAHLKTPAQTAAQPQRIIEIAIEVIPVPSGFAVKSLTPVASRIEARKELIKMELRVCEKVLREEMDRALAKLTPFEEDTEQDKEHKRLVARRFEEWVEETISNAVTESRTGTNWVAIEHGQLEYRPRPAMEQLLWVSTGGWPKEW